MSASTPLKTVLFIGSARAKRIGSVVANQLRALLESRQHEVKPPNLTRYVAVGCGAHSNVHHDHLIMPLAVDLHGQVTVLDPRETEDGYFMSVSSASLMPSYRGTGTRPRLHPSPPLHPCGCECHPPQ